MTNRRRTAVLVLWQSKLHQRHIVRRRRVWAQPALHPTKPHFSGHFIATPPDVDRHGIPIEPSRPNRIDAVACTVVVSARRKEAEFHHVKNATAFNTNASPSSRQNFHGSVSRSLPLRTMTNQTSPEMIASASFTPRPALPALARTVWLPHRDASTDRRRSAIAAASREIHWIFCRTAWTPSGW